MATKAEEFAARLLIRSVVAWSELGFDRHDSDDETSCSVRIYDLAEKILHLEEQAWPQVSIRYEGFLPTVAMREGRASAAGASRPDLYIYVGSAAILVEAKRLKVGGGLPRLYVVEGMQRFISGKYLIGGSRLGFMLGYIFAESSAEVLVAVNCAVNRTSWLSDSDLLFERTPCSVPVVRELDSSHRGGIRLAHLWVVIGANERGLPGA